MIHAAHEIHDINEHTMITTVSLFNKDNIIRWYRFFFQNNRNNIRLIVFYNSLNVRKYYVYTNVIKMLSTFTTILILIIKPFFSFF